MKKEKGIKERFRHDEKIGIMNFHYIESVSPKKLAQ